jgi:hypothetical protein
VSQNRVLSLTLRVRDDGSIVIDKASAKLARYGAESEKTARKTGVLGAAQRNLAAALGPLDGLFTRVGTAVAGLAGAAGLGLAIRRGFEYSQNLEQQRIGLAGTLSANLEYVDSMGRVADASEAYQAALVDSDRILRQIEASALETSATIPQLADAFNTAVGTARASGLALDLDRILDVTTRIVQAAPAMNVRMDQLAQEIRALFSGDVNEDALIAKRLGFTGAQIKELIREGKLYEEILQRTEAYGIAAAEQAKTLRGTIVNVMEVIDSALARAFEPLFAGLKPKILAIGTWFSANADTIGSVVGRIVGGIDRVIDTTGEWISNNRELLADIAALGTSVAAIIALGAAISALLSPIGMVIVGIIGIAAAWEQVRQFEDVEINGRPIAAWASWVATAIGGGLMQVGNVVLNLSTVVAEGMQAVLTTAGQHITGFLAFLADKVGAKDFAATMSTLSAQWKAETGENAAAAEAAWAKMLTQLEQDAEVTGDALNEALKAKELPSMASALSGLLEGALPVANQVKEAIASAMSGLTGSAPGGGLAELTDKQKEGLSDYIAWLKDFERQTDAIGDPVAKALAGNEKAREAALDKLDDWLKKLKGLALPTSGDAATGLLNQFFDQKALAIQESAIAESGERLRKLERDIQKRINDDRLDLITDALEREKQEKLSQLEEWFDAQREAIANDDKLTAEDKLKALNELTLERLRSEKHTLDQIQKLRDQDIPKTAAWADKVAATIKAKLGSMAQDMADLAVGSVDALQGALDDLFEGLFEGDLDFAGAFEGLVDDLQSMWAKMFSNMIARAATGKESIISQFRAMWDALGNSGGGIDAALGGAGWGSVIGGVGSALLGPGNYAAEGGSIGGAIGAAIGYYFFGNPQMGAVIGSVIGTAIGGAIEKSSDWINVAIEDGVATVTEKGLSKEGRERLERDINRYIGDQMKSWQSILDLFPEDLRAALKDLVKPLNALGVVEGVGDIKDAGAFDALGDFLGEELNQTLFASFERAILAGLAALGVSGDRIKEQLLEWGQLKGEELRGAIRDYVTTVIESIRVSDLFAGANVVNAAQVDLISQRPIMRIRTMVNDLDRLASAIPDLDPSDQIAAMREVNQLGQQIWDNMLQRVQQIDAAQRQFEESFAAQSERFQMALMGPQEQMNFLTDRINQTMGALAAASARGDDAEISRLGSVLQRYMEQVFGLGQTEGFDLSGIVDWLETIKREALGLGATGFEDARDQVVEQQMKAFSLLDEAAKALLEASANFVPWPGGGGGGVGRPGFPLQPDAPDIDGFTNAINFATSSVDTIPASFDAAALAAQHFARAILASSDHAVDSSYDVARRVQEMLDQLAQFGGGFKMPVSYAPGTSPTTLPQLAGGLDYVPYDGYVASLHRGESVLTARESAALRRGGGNMNVNVQVELTGPGSDLMRQWGVEVARTTIATIRDNPRSIDPGYDA